MDKLVIIPTYNEKENIEQILRKVMSLEGGFHVLVVDDGSPDGTAAIVKSLQQEFPGSIHIAERSGKQGLGTAYIFGFKWALKEGYEYIFEMDADFSHNPDDLIRLYEACAASSDVSIGSRYTSGGKIKNWPFDRIFISYGASVYTRAITWMPVKDCTAGFVCYKRKVLEAIPLDKVQFIGYAFQIEMKYRAWKLGFKLKEVPITFVDRKEGVSKMSKGIVKEAIFGVWKMRRFL
ncbi:polyprenol monophosphomannose synthase [Taibaiella chishuiensis]|uniref:Dolichol-phosphate mannosyltransferase n=1 Tax=Taibaiella chishuiensis TaxID=1434707 RepID=A0A2P8D1I0_9BACT|nr:polyprenol monophosphomannose synthase [Taibaiella chishuiensis]PSK91065.1 dolichol-phosphate mannosyltransferase [Taibaiella chishuiensis]